MCCFFTVLVFLGPRAGILLWYLINPSIWARAFPQSWLVPLAGSILVPWTTMMYVLLFQGGITGFEWVWIGLALFVDIAWWAGGGFRKRLPNYSGQY
jgi:hypothetical protein